MSEEYTFEDFRNDPDIYWHDYSVESVRVYKFLDSEGEESREIRINYPIAGYTNEDGEQCIYDAQGVFYKIPPKWNSYQMNFRPEFQDFGILEDEFAKETDRYLEHHRLTFDDFRHKTPFNWTDISSEKYRTYVFSYPNEGDKEITIKYPVALSVSRSGGHRIFDGRGTCHYIQSGWVHLFWQVEEGQPHFVK